MKSLKDEFVIFHHFSTQALHDRMYCVLGCSCIDEFEDMELDPLLVARHFNMEKARILTELAGIQNAAERNRRKAQLLNSAGNVLN